MKTRRMAKLAVMAAALLASPSARAATTNEVDIAALLAVANNNVETNANGWTLHKIGKYSDPVLQFNANDDWILSPDFGAPILRLEFSVRCTSTATRRLVIVNESEGGSGKEHEFSLCGGNNTDESQSFDFKPEERPSQFRLKINSDLGSSGNWGVGGLKIVFDFDAPSNLYVAKKGGDRCRLSWENGAGTVSNRLDTYLVERGTGDEVLFETDFAGFDGGAGTKTTNYTDRVAEMLGAAFSGTNVLGAAGTNGICQLGTPDERGFLRYAGLADYSNVELRLVLKRYETKDEKDVMLIAHEVDGVPIEYKTINLPREYDVRVVDLGKATAGSPIYIGYYNGVGSKRRVLIDSISIVRTHPDTLTTVDSRWIPTTQGAASFSTRDHEIGLVPKSEYRFEVRAKTAGVLVSDPAAVEVVLDSPPGFRFILR